MVERWTECLAVSGSRPVESIPDNLLFAFFCSFYCHAPCSRYLPFCLFIARKLGSRTDKTRLIPKNPKNQVMIIINYCWFLLGQYPASARAGQHSDKTDRVGSAARRPRPLMCAQCRTPPAMAANRSWWSLRPRWNGEQPLSLTVRLARIRGNWTFSKKPRQHHSYLRNPVLSPQRRLLIFLGAPGGAQHPQQAQRWGSKILPGFVWFA